MQYAAENLIPSTVELGGKSPNIFFADVWTTTTSSWTRRSRGWCCMRSTRAKCARARPGHWSKSRSTTSSWTVPTANQEDHAKATRGPDAQRWGPKLDPTAGEDHGYVDIGSQEGAEVLIGGERTPLGGELVGRLLLRTDSNQGQHQHEDLPGGDLRAGAGGDHLQGRSGSAGDCERYTVRAGRGVWTRNGSRAYRMGRAIKAGRVWTNCYHLYPAGAAFGGYKISG